jgi:hypothetical protein
MVAGKLLGRPASIIGIGTLASGVVTVGFLAANSRHRGHIVVPRGHELRAGAACELQIFSVDSVGSNVRGRLGGPGLS